MKTKKKAEKSIKVTRANKAPKKDKTDTYVVERPKR